jgi:aminopeptidase N
MRDSFTMDSVQNSDNYKKSFVKFSCTGFFLFISIFLCCIVAAALLVYNFATCPQIDPLSSENHHFRNLLKSERIVTTTTTELVENSTQNPKDLRLPRSIRPISYDVHLLPFLTSENFTFNGEIAIRISVNERSGSVTLHSASLIINWSFSHIQKLDNDGKPVANVSITNQYFIDEKQFLVLETGKHLEANENYVVKLQFVGSIKDNLQGFYKSSYDVGDETKWIASTQFQATDARR